MFLWILVCTGCARQVTPPSAPLQLAADPAAAYAGVRHREEMIHTLRARFSAVMQRGETVRQADGVLLVKKPDSFRMRLLSPFGLTVFDYTSWGPHARLELPLEGKRLVDDQLRDQSAFSQGDLRQAFLRADAAFPGMCTPRAAGAEIVVDCRDDQGTLLRVIHIEPRTQTIIQEISFVGGQLHLAMQFADYREVGSVLLPFAIALNNPERQVKLEITLRSYEVNPALPDELFARVQDAQPAAVRQG